MYPFAGIGTGTLSASSSCGKVTAVGFVASTTLKVKSIWNLPVVPHCSSALIIVDECSAAGASSIGRYHSLLLRQTESFGTRPSSGAVLPGGVVLPPGGVGLLSPPEGSPAAGDPPSEEEHLAMTS